MEAPSPEPKAGVRRTAGPNRSACHTGLRREPSAEAPLSEPAAGARGTAEPNRSACHTGSCQELAAEAPSADDGAVSPRTARHAPVWLGLHFDDSRASPPVLRITA